MKARSAPRALASGLRYGRGMRDVCHDIKAHTGQVLALWQEFARREPWLSLPEHHRIDHLPEVIVGLTEASLCDPADEAAHLQKVWAAAEHGQHRREQGFAMELIFHEYHLLRQALWRYIRDHAEMSKQAEAINRIDTAISLSTMASLRGYHRRELEEKGEWPQTIDRLAGESPLLTAHRLHP